MQGRGADAPVVGPDLLVQREQVGGDLHGDRRALLLDSARLVVQCGSLLRDTGGELRALGRELVSLGRQLRGGRARAVDALHDLQLHVLEVGLASGQGVELGLDGLQLLGVADAAGIEKVPVAGDPVENLLYVLIRAGLVSLEVAEDGRRGDRLVADARQTSLQLAETGSVGQGVGAVLDLRQPGVVILEIQEAELCGGLGFQSGLPR